MKVLKFGGTSVANAENIQKVVNIVKRSNDPQIIVVSALGGITDLLISVGTLAEKSDETYKETLQQLEKKHLDTARGLLPVTHQSSCLSMIKQHFNELEEICTSVFYLKIKTNSNFGFAAVNFSITNDLISYAITASHKKLFLMPGFIASDEHGNTTTLGRGGSDYTAAIFASAINAKTLEIWTDVTGMMTADPRWVPNAKTINRISYQEAMELSHFGAKVIYPPTIQPVLQKQIPTWIKNTFAPDEAGTVLESVTEHEGDIITGISSINAIALLSLEGSGMVGVPGFSAQGSSERNISAVIATDDVKKGVNVLHEAFFESTYKQLNIFIVGVGNVGSKLLSQLKQQQPFLLEHLNLQVRVTGIANSKKMLFVDNGSDINLDNWKYSLEKGQSTQLDKFADTIIQKNLRNSVFVDVTANEEVATVYGKLLSKAISVVACNKIATSSAYQNYSHLKSLAKEYNALYLFETNVGAGLPVIGTLNDLRRSGDKVNKIQAVLSGTLNFVFNHYDGTRPFAEVVKQAQDEGYTEPDPRLDLGGTDVMRKIMILAREAGEHIEMEDITNNTFLPASCFEGSVQDFYKEMSKQEAHFKALYNEATAKNCKLKFVAEYESGKASVGLQHIQSNSDFYHLYGKDNIVLFYTQRYPEQPLVVKGAGAGADVTASGVFADIIRVARV